MNQPGHSLQQMQRLGNDQATLFNAHCECGWQSFAQAGESEAREAWTHHVHEERRRVEGDI